MKQRKLTNCLVLAATAVLAASAARAEPMVDRITEMAARSRVVIHNSDLATQLNVSLNAEGLPIAKAILRQSATHPEVQLEALVAPVPANPRDPQEARERTTALYVHGTDQDTVLSVAQPYLELELDAGSGVLRVANLAHALPAARLVDHLRSDDLVGLVQPREFNLDGASLRALGALKETVRGELTRNGQRCDAAALLYSLFPGELTIELQPRCAGGGTSQGRLVYNVSAVTFSGDGLPQDGELRLTASELAPTISGGLLLVPKVRAGELYTPDSPGLLSYGAGESGVKTIDFAALLSGAGVGAPCTPDAFTLCLDGKVSGDRRFQVQLSWFTSQNGGDGGSALATPLQELGISKGGFFSFFPNNPEMLIKVLDGCAITGHYWVFAAPTTNVGFTLEVIDTVARDGGAPESVYRYVRSNPDLAVATAFADTSAYDTCDYGS